LFSAVTHLVRMTQVGSQWIKQMKWLCLPGMRPQNFLAPACMERRITRCTHRLDPCRMNGKHTTFLMAALADPQRVRSHKVRASKGIL